MRVPQTPPAVELLLDELVSSDDPEAMRRVVDGRRAVDEKGRYLHWDDMRHRRPPDDLTHEQWWLGTSLSRRSLRKQMPLQAVDGTRFSICMVDAVWEALHRIDQAAAGHVLADDPEVIRGGRNRHVVSSLIEEAIASSQLEGASSTRSAAKRMLLAGRSPRDHSERMIYNNFVAMSAVKERADGSEPLSTDLLCELHRVLTVDTLDDPMDVGRIQGPDDERVWVSWHGESSTGQRVHFPPSARELPSRAGAMCAFANGETDDGFVHPVLRAVVLHFWLAYDHPFTDGNGRLARSLFYWSMLRSGFWLAEYLAVSSILRKAPAQYARSFLLTETDGFDLTYFALYQLGVIERAIDALWKYARRKHAEVREVEELLVGHAELNYRQRDVLAVALRDTDADFAIARHQRKHAVTYQTARTDLLALVELGLVMKQRDGKAFRFLPLPDLPERIRGIDDARA